MTGYFGESYGTRPKSVGSTRLSKSFLGRSSSLRTGRLSSDWESTRLKIELSPVQIREAALLAANNFVSRECAIREVFSCVVGLLCSSTDQQDRVAIL